MAKTGPAGNLNAQDFRCYSMTKTPEDSGPVSALAQIQGRQRSRCSEQSFLSRWRGFGQSESRFAEAHGPAHWPGNCARLKSGRIAMQGLAASLRESPRR